MQKFLPLTPHKPFKVLVAGAGGLGCEIIKNLLKTHLILHIIIVDYDHVSETNLNRQFCFRKADVQKSKVMVIAQYFAPLKN